MAGISQECHRIADHAKDGLNDDESYVENDAYGESPAKACRHMVMN